MEWESNKSDSAEHSDCSKSYPSDDFNRIIGFIEDIVISTEFQKLQNDFLDKHCHVFTNEEENKICYMEIFNEYTRKIEDFITANLVKQTDTIDMDAFSNELRTIGAKFDGEIFELLFSLSDFQTFKALMLDFKEYKMHRNNFSALDECIIVKKL